MSVQEHLKEFRESAGLSQSQLASRIGVSQARINKFENGTIVPSHDIIKKLADTLDITEYELVNGDYDISAFMTPFGSAPDLTSHAPHYHAGTPYEVYKVLEVWDLPHHLASAIEYIVRHNLKGTAVSDLKKAKWRIEKMIELLERNAK